MLLENEMLLNHILQLLFQL